MSSGLRKVCIDGCGAPSTGGSQDQIVLAADSQERLSWRVGLPSWAIRGANGGAAATSRKTYCQCGQNSETPMLAVQGDLPRGNVAILLCRL
jgi:hypothetical protein